jgi:hypothetical protein
MVLKGHFKNYVPTEHAMYATISATVETLIMAVEYVLLGGVYCSHFPVLFVTTTNYNIHGDRIASISIK